MLIGIDLYKTKTLRGKPRRVFIILSKEVVEKPQISGLFKYPKGHAECSNARRAKNEPRGVYLHTLSGTVCSATQQISVFEQP